MLDGAPAGLTADQAAAAARAVIAGHGLPAAVAARFADTPVCTLVSFDADRIQAWVFASERVQVAKGASLTLDRLNWTLRERALAIPGVHGVVYSAGGGGMLFAGAAAAGSQALARQLEERVRDWLEANSRELTFTVVSLPLFARDLLPSTSETSISGSLHRFTVVDGLRGALIRLQVELRARKDASPRRGGPGVQLLARPGAASERCPSCGRRPPGADPLIDDGPQSWCGWCRGLRQVCLDGARHPGAPQEGASRSPTFTDLAESSQRRRRYLGFVAVDGNGMGSVLQGIRDFVQLRAFSEVTSHIYSAARAGVEAVLAGGFLDSRWEPADAYLSLLSGGDEVTVVLPAAAAPLTALTILRSVESGFDEATARGGLLHQAFQQDAPLLAKLAHAGAAAGLVIAQPSYPVRLLRRYADTLQKQAKAACAASDSRSGVAWSLLTDSSPLPDGASGDAEPSELCLDSFEQLWREARAARDSALPRAALQRLVNQYRDEADSLRSLPPGSARREALDRLAANFFRYQLARSHELAAWWDAVAPAVPAPGRPEAGDRVAAWFGAGGGRKLAQLVDLLAIEPFPDAAESPR
jgi:hypothetical protein